MVAKPSATKKSAQATRKPRMRKAPEYRSFRPHKRIKPSQSPLPKVWTLWQQTWKVIKERPKVFAGLAAIYLGLTLVFVRGMGPGLDLVGTKDVFNELNTGAGGGAVTIASLFGVLVSGSGSETNPGASVYQSIIVVLVILATVWLARQQGATARIKIKDAFYRGMYPLVPFILILMVVGLQLVPAAVGSWLYNVVVNGGLAVTSLEKGLWMILVLLFMTLSLYMAISSVFALFIVTLPDMTPMRALRSARKLVLHRRWIILRKFVAMLIILFSAGALILLPFLIWLPAVAEPIFSIESTIVLIVSVTFMYNLYLGLLND